MACIIITTSIGGHSVKWYFRELGNELAAQGHRILFLIDGQKRNVESASTNPAYLVWPSFRPVHWKDAGYLCRVIRKYRPDAIVCNFGAENIGVLASWFMRVPARIVWHHTLSTQDRQNSLSSGLKRQILRIRKLLVYCFATRFIVNSAAMLADFRKMYRIERAPCDVIPYLIENAEEPPAAERSIDLLAVGALLPAKGHCFLIRALPAIRKNYSEVKAVIIGDGPIRTELEHLATELHVNDMVTFTGSLPREAVFEYMSNAKILVTPSTSEAFGLVNIEALRAGTPVIASDCDGMRENVIDGYSGYLVPPRDPEAIAEKAVSLLSNPALLEQMQRNARSHFDESFSARQMSRHAKKLEQMIALPTLAALAQEYLVQFVVPAMF